jgi:amidase
MTFIGRSAVELAALVRGGEATAEAVVAEHLAHARRVDGDLNMVTVTRGERALADARAVDAHPRRDSLRLAGVPVVVKDSIDVAGELSRHGSRGGSSVAASVDDPTVARLRAAGAVVIAKTTMCELAIWPFTESKAWGWTRNPWQLDRSPGGSSGGCGAAVAAGAAPLALGADGGGSIRIPSAVCGLFGLKAGSGVVPASEVPGSNWYGLTELGPMATTVADAAVMLDVLAGTDRFAEVPDAGRLRVAISLQPPVPGVGLDPRVRDAVLWTGYALEQAGHRVFRADPPYPLTLGLPFLRRWLAAIADQADLMDARWLEPRSAQLAAVGRFLRVFGAPCPASAARWRERMNAWFSDYDVLLSPVVASPPPSLGYWDGKGLLSTLWSATRFMAYTPPWNLAGFPSASVPTGERVDKVPVGAQLVGPQGSEAFLLSLAAQLERIRPWARHAPLLQAARA